MKRTKRKCETPGLTLRPLSEFDFRKSGRYLVAFGAIIQSPEQQELTVWGELWEATFDADIPYQIYLTTAPHHSIPIIKVTAWAFLGTYKKNPICR